VVRIWPNFQHLGKHRRSRPLYVSTHKGDRTWRIISNPSATGKNCIKTNFSVDSSGTRRPDEHLGRIWTRALEFCTDLWRVHYKVNQSAMVNAQLSLFDTADVIKPTYKVGDLVKVKRKTPHAPLSKKGDIIKIEAIHPHNGSCKFWNERTESWGYLYPEEWKINNLMHCRI